METIDLELGRTYKLETQELTSPLKKGELNKKDTKFFAVQFIIFEKYKVLEFDSLESMLEETKNTDIIYRFIECNDANNNQKIFILKPIPYTNKILGFQNIYGLNNTWNLFVNSKNDVAVQHIKFPKVDLTVRFRYLPIGSYFYCSLSCLIYVITNYDLNTQDEVRAAFKKIEDFVDKKDFCQH